mmetsp:Transcript_12017/g.18828  ORF Transcript_12017/g.18828 Transcript_12017/m.18828 type:complete len:274 (-) Transcript_12017:843-1664(-)|eukprot:CAMPEP_0184294230 /NCGR_PEP_ID=MMETSP1049-20130417/5475_1 /TAXON_ID=77928 /ORGANISM="Proteomonas sulcata, Strain CCMP704" /LENGTH=273 /DNA_ID=CAMNT_0026602445 /DNA_START=183 /DNA_END=1004 /DNA_ORIENTATION=-
MSKHPGRLGTPSSISPSVGALELGTMRSNQKYLTEMHSYIKELQELTPDDRFQMTQQALLDMQNMVEIFKNLRNKAEANKEEFKKLATDREAENSKLHYENSKLVRQLELRDASLAKERNSNKQLEVQLTNSKQQAFEHMQEEAALRRRVKFIEEESAMKSDEIHRLDNHSKNLHAQVEKQSSEIRNLKRLLQQAQNQRTDAEKEAKSLNKEVRISRKVEKQAWHTASDTRKRILDGLDEAIMMNPNHFNEFNLHEHRDRKVTVAKLASLSAP